MAEEAVLDLWHRKPIFLFFAGARPALGLIQFHIQRIPEALSPGGKADGE
jgi:hypothetical protein